MKNVTIYFPYYNSKDLLIFNLNHYSKMNSELLKKIKLFIVDDGSKKFPAKDVLLMKEELCSKLNITLYRIDIDIPWNTPEANNLAFSKIDTKYVIRSDIDHIYSEKLIHDILEKNIPDNRVLFFKRRRLIDTQYNIKKKVKPGNNIYIISVKDYWKTGGYNEYFSGDYGDDLDFIPRLKKKFKIVITPFVNDVLVNSGTRNLNRSTENTLKKLSINNKPFLNFVNKNKYILSYINKL